MQLLLRLWVVLIVCLSVAWSQVNSPLFDESTGDINFVLEKLAGSGQEYIITGFMDNPDKMTADEFTIAHFNLNSPLRYVIDIATEAEVVPVNRSFNSGPVRQVRIGKRQGGLRFVIEFLGEGSLLTSLQKEGEKGVFRVHIAKLASKDVS